MWTLSDSWSGTIYIKGYTAPTKLGVTQKQADTADTITGAATVTGGTPYAFEWSSDGSAYGLRVAGTELTLTTESGGNSGDWFADVSPRRYFMLGAWPHDYTTSDYNAMKVSAVMVFDAPLSAQDRAELAVWVDDYYGLSLS